MIPLIICVVGASGSGKTTAAMILQEKFGWNAIVSYTTRPIRKGEVNGRDHWFVSSDSVPPRNRMCAYTKFGNYEYWSTWGQFLTLFPNIYVIDEKGIVDMRSKTSAPIQFQVITIKIKRDDLKEIDEARKARDEDRIVIPDDQYDYVIENNGSIESFKSALCDTAQRIIKKQEEYEATR